MRVHLDNERKILGFYPEDIAYPVLPTPLVGITNEQYLDILAESHTHLDEDGNGFTPPVPPFVDLSRITLREKLQNLGLSDTDIEILLKGTI